jgi:hypothetical protein
VAGSIPTYFITNEVNRASMNLISSFTSKLSILSGGEDVISVYVMMDKYHGMTGVVIDNQSGQVYLSGMQRNGTVHKVLKGPHPSGDPTIFVKFVG